MGVVIEDAVGGHGYAVEQHEGFAVVEGGVCGLVDHDHVEVAVFVADVDLAHVFAQYFFHGCEPGIFVEVISEVGLAVEGGAVDQREAVAAEAIAGINVLDLHADAMFDEQLSLIVGEVEGGQGCGVVLF